MNLALPALVVFIILLPGFVARARFKRIERLSLDYAPFGRTVTEAVIFAIALHSAWVLAMNVGLCRELSIDNLLGLLISSPQTQTESILSIARQWDEIALYFGSIIVAPYVAFPVFRSMISNRRWDRRGHPLSPIFRFHDAPWYYLLSGADFERQEIPDFIKITAVVDVAGAPVLFTGILAEFFVNNEGVLDRLVLENVARRPFERDKGTPDSGPERFYPIDGDYFVLRYAESITLNVEYFKLEPEQNVTP